MYKSLFRNVSRDIVYSRKQLFSSMIVPSDFDATKYRSWVQFNTPAACTNQTVSVMSYNLLSRHYVWKPVFGYLDQEYLNWSDYRFPLINRIIRQFNCDIMCFQEMEHLVYEKFWSKSFPSSNYQSFYLRKPKPMYWGEKPLENMDGVGIFVNKDKFEVLEQQQINFGEYILQHHTKFNVTKATAERVIPRNTVALLLKLRDKRNDKILYVSNTHLYWSPDFNDVKLIQTKLLLNILRDFIDASSTSNPCIIMCGDFNSNPSSSVFKLLSSGKLDACKCCEFDHHDHAHKSDSDLFHKGLLEHPFHLSCAYELILPGSHGSARKKLEFTSFSKSLIDVVDHIWYSNAHFRVTKLLGEVDPLYFRGKTIVGFPDSQFPSDHIPLVTELAYI